MRGLNRLIRSRMKAKIVSPSVISNDRFSQNSVSIAYIHGFWSEIRVGSKDQRVILPTVSTRKCWEEFTNIIINKNTRSKASEAYLIIRDGCSIESFFSAFLKKQSINAIGIPYLKCTVISSFNSSSLLLPAYSTAGPLSQRVSTWI